MLGGGSLVLGTGKEVSTSEELARAGCGRVARVSWMIAGSRGSHLRRFRGQVTAGLRTLWEDVDGMVAPAKTHLSEV